LRYQNRRLLAEMSKDACELCGQFNNNAAHHIITKARQGGDYPWNLITLCFPCHREIHDIPMSEFIEKYPKIIRLFEIRGFIWDDFSKRFYRPR
jgi:hypothetical protein